jgi:hypothetical protein
MTENKCDAKNACRLDDMNKFLAVLKKYMYIFVAKEHELAKMGGRFV